MPHNLTRTRGRPTRPSRLANPPAHHRGHGPVRGGRDAREAMNFATARRTAGRNRRLRGERRSPSSDTRRGTASSPPVMAGGKGCRAVAMNHTAAARHHEARTARLTCLPQRRPRCPAWRGMNAHVLGCRPAVAVFRYGQRKDNSGPNPPAARVPAAIVPLAGAQWGGGANCGTDTAEPC